MKKILLFSSAILILLLGSCKGNKKEVATTEIKIEVVKTQPLDTRKINQTVDYTGTLLPFEEIYLAPGTPGRIERVRVDVGHRVARGALLVQMDRSQLQQAEVQLNNLALDMRRMDTLQKTGSIAQQRYDQLKAQYDIARTNVNFLRTNTRIVAPFSGIISGKYYESGEIYSGAPNTPVGKAAIVSLVQIYRLKVLVSISEQYFPMIKAGMPAEIRSDIVPDKVFEGRISKVYPTLDAASRTFNVEITINNSGEQLRPGMFARVSLNLGEVDAVLIPDNAVLKMQGSNDRYVFVDNNGTAKRVAVEVGKRHDALVEVISDQLKPGDRIIVTGQARLLDGMKIKVVNN